MYMMFVLEHEDVLPLGDLAIRRGIEQLYGDGEEELTREEMREIAETWRPYRSVAARYIWAAYESGLPGAERWAPRWDDRASAQTIPCRATRGRRCSSVSRSSPRRSGVILASR